MPASGRLVTVGTPLLNPPCGLLFASSCPVNHIVHNANENSPRSLLDFPLSYLGARLFLIKHGGVLSGKEPIEEPADRDEHRDKQRKQDSGTTGLDHPQHHQTDKLHGSEAMDYR